MKEMDKNKMEGYPEKNTCYSEEVCNDPNGRKGQMYDGKDNMEDCHQCLLICLFIKGLRIACYMAIAAMVCHFMIPPGRGIWLFSRLFIILVAIRTSYAVIVEDLYNEYWYGGGFIVLFFYTLLSLWIQKHADYSYLDRLLE